MGIANIINTSTSSGGGGGEIIRELVNSSDGQGLHFDGVSSHISLANSAGTEFGTSDFSLEFILNQTKESTDETYYFTAPYTGDNRMGFWYDKANTTLKIYFRATSNVHYAFGYDIAADFGTPTHFVVSADRSGNAVLYRNGTEVASVDISGSSAVNIGDSNANPFYISANAASTAIIGSLYRFRTWNKALTHDEVDTCFQRADVPFADQYGSQTSKMLNGLAWTGASGTTAPNSWTTGSQGTYTIDSSSGSGSEPALKIARNSDNPYIYQTFTAVVNKKYRVKYRVKNIDATHVKVGIGSSAIGTQYNSTNHTSTSWADFDETYTATTTTFSVYVQVATTTGTQAGYIDSLVVEQVGCVTDYDLAFANPTQSLMVQDRAGAADGTASATGVSQTQPIVQLNSKAISVSAATSRTPADGDIIADKIGIGVVPANKLQIGSIGSVSYGGNDLVIGDGTRASAFYQSASAFNTYTSTGNDYIVDSGGEIILDAASGEAINFKVAASTKMTIDATGATTITKAAAGTALLLDSGGTNTYLGIKESGGTYAYIANDGGDLLFQTPGSSYSTKLQITSAGYSLFNCTAVPSTSVAGLALYGASGGSRSSSGSATTSYQHFLFINGNGTVGNISTSASATTYATSSDYRLKENLEPLTGALDRIEQLPVYRFNFKADSETIVDGFIAHEAQAIVPESVVGEKDAMQTVVVKEAVEAKPATYWAEGDELPEGVAVGDEKTPAIEAQEEVTEEQPDYQGIDQSKLVPLLVGAVKELKAKVEALENA